jgi:hypothetical protein
LPIAPGSPLYAQTYTDANMLPVSDAVALLSAFAAKQENPQIDPQKSATEGRVGSSSGAINGSEPKLLPVGDERFSLSETAFCPKQSRKGRKCAMQGSNLRLLACEANLLVSHLFANLDFSFVFVRVEAGAGIVKNAPERT